MKFAKPVTLVLASTVVAGLVAGCDEKHIEFRDFSDAFAVNMNSSMHALNLSAYTATGTLVAVDLSLIVP